MYLSGVKSASKTVFKSALPVSGAKLLNPLDLRREI